MRWIPRVLVAAALLALPFVLGQLPPVRAALIAAVEVMRGGGALGAAAFLAAYTAGCLVTAPIWIFNGIAGYAFGPVRGALLASPANAVAMTVAFLVGRFALSRPLGRWLGNHPKWAAVHGAVEGDAWRIGFLLRLSPLAPQNLLSYGFSLTPMRLRTYVLATWLGLLPIICLQAYLGSLIHDVADLIEGRRPPLGPWGWAATGASFVVTAVAVLVVARIGHRALKQAGVLGAPRG
jgi:uncharacterized membrane protein YdjX (TVP38/TMEM64 family)